MVRKFNLIFLSSLLLILILGTTSFALTDLDDMSEETMQNIIDYCIERQSNETYLDILENVNLKMLSNFWNETLAPSMANYEPIEALEQLLITYDAGNNRILIYYTNNTIGNSLWQAKVEYVTGSGYNQYVIKNNGESFFGITINSTSSFTNYKNSGGFLKLGNDITINENNSTISFPTIRSMGYGASVDFIPKDSSKTYQFFLVPSITITGTSEPLPTPTPTPTPGGDTGGSGTGGDTGGGTTTPDYSEDLDNIQTGIVDINNNIGQTNNKLDNISGELSNINNNLTTVPDISDTAITNDDITSNLDFEFEQDPYTNFWLELTTGLGNSFTNSKREISIQFRDKTHIISLDNFSVQIPSALKPFLTIISTVFITWKMLQYIKIIIDNISSGNIDEVLEMNEEEGITNLF